MTSKITAPEPHAGKVPARPKQREMKRFVRFVALGGCAAGVNFGSRFLLSTIMPFEFAVVAAYMTGMLVAFLLFRFLVFPEAALPLRVQTTMFVLVNLVGMAQVWVVSQILARWALPAIHYPGPIEATSHLIGIATPIVTSFLGHRHLSFRGR